MDYVHSTIQLKSLDAEQRIVEGVASTPTADRTGDVMEPGGATYALPMPLLWQHKHDQPIGHVLSARVTPTGILVRAQIAKGIPYVDQAWALIKARLVGGLSIGWRPLEAPEQIQKSGRTVGLRYKAWEWLELSAVTVPMNAQTSILSIKTIDAADRAALGTRSLVSTPGATGLPIQKAMNISEQLTAARAELQTKSARLEELSLEDGDLSADDLSERDTLTGAVQDGTKKVARLAALESAQAAQASTISYTPRPASVTARSGRIEVVKKDIPANILFARYAMAVAFGKGSYNDTLTYARQRWDAETPEVSAYIKALAGTAVAASPGWGSELAYPQNFEAAFVDLLRARTLIGRIPGFASVPFNVRFTEQLGGSTVAWVGEAAPKPVGELSFTEHFFTQSKIAGIVVLSDELVRLSSPSAQEKVSSDLTKAIQLYMDQQFITPSVGATANNPASITNGATTTAASGTSAADVRADLATAIGSFTAANISTESLAIVTTESLALNMALLTNALGQPEFPTVGPRGGTLFGYPLIASNAVPTGLVVFIVANEVLLADDGRVTLDASNQATLDMAGGSSPTFNLWQKNCTGVRAERWVRWARRREDAVYYLTAAAYAPA